MSVTQSSPVSSRVSTYISGLSSQSLSRLFFLCPFLKWGVPHIYYASGPLHFLSYMLFLFSFLKIISLVFIFSSYHLFAVDSQVYISNTYSSLEFQICIANSLLKLCVQKAKQIQHVQRWIYPLFSQYVSFLCLFIIYAVIQSEPWCFRRLFFLPGDWLPRDRKQKLPDLLRTMSVTGASSLLINSVAQTNHRVYPDSMQWRNWLLCDGEVASSYRKRVFGMSTITVTVFGKCNRHNGKIRNQIQTQLIANEKQTSLNRKVIFLHMFRKTVSSLLESSWNKEIAGLLNH